MDYYCEICNKNFRVVQSSVARCPLCGWISHAQPIHQDEKKRRDEYYGECYNCQQIQHALPIQVVLDIVKYNRFINTRLIKTIKNGTQHYFIKDRRYKSGVRSTGKCEMIFCYFLIGLILTIATYGIALIPIGIYYYYQYRKDQERIIGIHQHFDQIQQNLHQQSQLSLYVCSKCFNAIQIYEKRITEQKNEQIINLNQKLIKSTTILKICEFCGNSNIESATFCVFCGYKYTQFKNDKNINRYIPSEIRKIVFERDCGQCVRCHTRKSLQYDHIIPFSKGGASTVENLQLLCANCNMEKRDKIDG